MIERELTKDLNGVGRIIPTKLGISRPTLTPLKQRRIYGVNNDKNCISKMQFKKGSLS